MRADAPAGNKHRVLGKAALVKHGDELLFHAHRAAAAPDVAGDFVDVGDVDHRHALDACGLGSLFQVQLGQHRHDKDVIIAVRTLGDQRFEHLGRVLPGQPRHVRAVHSLAFLMGVFMCGVGDLRPFQHPHCIGFCFFWHIGNLFIFSLPSPKGEGGPQGRMKGACSWQPSVGQ